MGIERLNEFWPEWECGDVLGKGSFGKVYKAENKEGGFSEFSAIKVISIPSDEAEVDALRNEGMSVSDTKEYFHDIVNDFINEIKLLVSLKGAPNIVAVEGYKILEKKTDIGYDIFIRMELLHSFKELIDDHIPTEDEIVKMGIDIANALEICQKRNIIHRDIKPANIFFDDFGNFKLGDFGIAKELEKTTGAASSKGTFSYMAPEVAHGQRYDSTVDIYSLGLVMYTLLNGNRAPFIPRDGRVTYNDRKDANDRRLAGEALPKIDGVSQTLNDIILAACAYDPSRRFRSATAFKNALKAYMNMPKQTTVPAPPVPKQNIDETTAARKPEPKAEIDATVAVAHKPVKQQVEQKPSFKEIHPVQPKTEVKPKSVETPKKRKKGIIIAVSVLLVLAIIAVAVIPGMLDNRDRSKVKNTENSVDDTATEITEDICIENIVDQGTTGDVEWLYGDNTLVISGDGAMEDYDENEAPWYRYNNEIKKIIIHDGVTSIGDYAFWNCDSMTSITIPDSVTSIGVGAFYDCSSLTSITIPDSVTSIAYGTFGYCSSLTSIIIPDSVTSIGDYAFCNCSSLTSITIPDSVTSIGIFAFEYCSSLTSITIPDSVTSIGSGEFSYCTNLTSITIPDSVTSIGYDAFYGCDNLTIKCSSDSYAEQYAIKKGIPHTLI